MATALGAAQNHWLVDDQKYYSELATAITYDEEVKIALVDVLTNTESTCFDKCIVA